MSGRRATRSQTPRATPPVSIGEALNQNGTNDPAHNTRASGRRAQTALRPELVTHGASSYGNPNNLAHNAGLTASDVRRGFSAAFEERAAPEPRLGPPSSPLAARAPSAPVPKKAPAPRRRAQPTNNSPSAQQQDDSTQAEENATPADVGTASAAPRPEVPAVRLRAYEEPADDDPRYHPRPIDAMSAQLAGRAARRSKEPLPFDMNDMLEPPYLRPAPPSSSRATHPSPSRALVIAIVLLAFSILFAATRDSSVIDYALSYVKPILQEQTKNTTIVHVPPLTSALIPRPKEVAINFFSPGTGATVDPRLSTPSMYHFKDLGDRQKYPLLHDVTAVQQPNQALQPYHDIGDAWCTTTKHLILPEDGFAQQPIQAQLAVNLAHPVYPRIVVVESPPSHVLLDPAARPGAMSLWIQVQDPDLRRRVRAAALGLAPDEVPPAQPESLTIGRATTPKGGLLGYLTSSTPPTSDLALDETWVRVAGKEHGEVVAADGQVFFPLDVDMEALGVPVHRAVFRVESNLGQEYTCLYRVSLSGKLVAA